MAVVLACPPCPALWLCYVTEVAPYVSGSSCEPAGTESSVVCACPAGTPGVELPFLERLQGRGNSWCVTAQISVR